MAARATVTSRVLVVWLAAAVNAACGDDGGVGVDASADVDAEVSGDTGVDDVAPKDITVDTAEDADTRVDDTEAPVVCDVSVPLGDFDDHTVAGFEAPECVFAYGARGNGPLQIKFIMDRFGDGELTAPMRFMAPSFYRLHDEWYWFRLLNGQPIVGLADVQPVFGQTFASIEAVYQAYAGVPSAELPLDLRWASGSNRLYSDDFYDYALNRGDDKPRFFGVGSLLYFDANPKPRCTGTHLGLRARVRRPHRQRQAGRVFSASASCTAARDRVSAALFGAFDKPREPGCDAEAAPRSVPTPFADLRRSGRARRCRRLQSGYHGWADPAVPGGYLQRQRRWNQ